MIHLTLIGITLALLAISQTSGVELTFELSDNARECFYEEIEKGTSVTLEFQVSRMTARSCMQK